MEHCPTTNNNKPQDEDTMPFETYSDKEDILNDKLEGLQMLANNPMKEWPKLCTRMIEHNMAVKNPEKS